LCQVGDCLTLGYELEFLGANILKIGKEHYISCARKETSISYYDFHLKTEANVTKQNHFGGELISPVYTNLEKCKQELREHLEILIQNQAYLQKNSERTGFHIHLGMDIFEGNRERYHAFFTFLFVVQEYLYEIAKGNDAQIRSNVWKHAKPLCKEDVSELLNRKFLLLHQFMSKEYCINFSIHQPTVELRYFNASLDYLVLCSYLDLAWSIACMIKYATYDLENILAFYHYHEKLPIQDQKLFLQKMLQKK